MIASGWRRKARPTTITAAAALRAAWRKAAHPATFPIPSARRSPQRGPSQSSSGPRSIAARRHRVARKRLRGDAARPPMAASAATPASHRLVRNRSSRASGAHYNGCRPLRGQSRCSLRLPVPGMQNELSTNQCAISSPARSPTRPSSSTPPSCAWNGSPRFTKIRDFVSSRSTLETGHFRDTGRRFYRLIT